MTLRLDYQPFDSTSIPAALTSHDFQSYRDAEVGHLQDHGQDLCTTCKDASRVQVVAIVREQNVRKVAVWTVPKYSRGKASRNILQGIL